MNTILIIGGNGFVGYHVLKRLICGNARIRSISRTVPECDYIFDSVDYRTGDIWERDFLLEALQGVDTILDFMSTTMPGNKEISLENEINTTLRYHNYILSNAVANGVRHYLFPSSGGAVYGSRQATETAETDLLLPSTPYGVGKKMAESIIHYYVQRCGINASILRIGNVYGSQRFRDRPQGVIDVFIQNALERKPVVIWGNASTAIRDYVYLEDVAEAVKMIVDSNQVGAHTYNVGTGIGTSVSQIVDMIEQTLGYKLEKEHRDNKSSGIDRIVLSNKKIHDEVGWQPRIDLKEGIRRTVDLKKSY